MSVRVEKLNDERIVINSLLHGKTTIEWDSHETIHIFLKPKENTDMGVLVNILCEQVKNSKGNDFFINEAKRLLEAHSKLKSITDTKFWVAKVQTFLTFNKIGSLAVDANEKKIAVGQS